MDYFQATIHDWWYDKEFNDYYALLETEEGQLRLITTPRQEGKC